MVVYVRETHLALKKWRNEAFCGFHKSRIFTYAPGLWRLGPWGEGKLICIRSPQLEKEETVIAAPLLWYLTLRYWMSRWSAQVLMQVCWWEEHRGFQWRPHCEGRIWAENKYLRDSRESCAFRPECLAMVLFWGNCSWMVALRRKTQANKVTARVEEHSLIVVTRFIRNTMWYQLKKWNVTWR